MQCCPRASRQHCTGNILFNVVLILLGQHCTGKNLVRFCPRRSKQHCMGKIMLNVVVILLGQHCTGKNFVQEATDYNITKEKFYRQLYRQKSCALLPKRLQTILHMKKTLCNVLWITSLFGNFTFKRINFLIINGCCKCRANIVQIFPKLHKKSPESTLNKRARLYGTPSLYHEN